MSTHRRTMMSRRTLLSVSASGAAGATLYAVIPNSAPAAPTGRKPKPSAPPRGVHPRVLINAKQAQNLKNKFADPIVAPRYQALLEAATLKTDGTLPEGVFSMTVRSAIEGLAFRYLVENDKPVGLKAVQYLRNFLRTFKPLDPHKASVTDIRNTGLALMLSAIVYDWCHDLLTKEDQQAVITAMKNLAAHQEVGYPPTNLSAVVSHASEYELQRDQLAAGIAVYDEDQEMFDLVSARFRKEYVPARNFFYKAGRYHQGDSYQGTRFAPEMFATVLFNRMGGDAGYIPQQQHIITDWIYQRRPDGQLLRAGDSFQSSSPPESTGGTATRWLPCCCPQRTTRTSTIRTICASISNTATSPVVRTICSSVSSTTPACPARPPRPSR
ncbi:hypothetical protein [Streptomyces sp. NPDC055109]